MTTAVVEHRLGFLPRWPGRQSLNRMPRFITSVQPISSRVVLRSYRVAEMTSEGTLSEQWPLLHLSLSQLLWPSPLKPLCPRSTPSHLLTSGIHPIFILPNKPNTCLPLRWLLTGACGYEARVTDCCSANEWAALPFFFIKKGPAIGWSVF